MQAIQNSGYKVGVAIFDGVLVERKDFLSAPTDFAAVAMDANNRPTIPEEELRKWEGCIAEDTGLIVRLEEKPMELNLSFVLDGRKNEGISNSLVSNKSVIFDRLKSLGKISD